MSESLRKSTPEAPIQSAIEQDASPEAQAPHPAEAEVRRPLLPIVSLPPRIPTQKYRPAQANIPDDRAARDHLKKLADQHVADLGLVPPVSLNELAEIARDLRMKAGVDEVYQDYLGVHVNNAIWHDSLASIPFERRLLLVPKCLRDEEHCPAPFDDFGLLCKECGLCSLQDLTVEAERLGYAVLVAEGSAIVSSMIATGKIEGIVGVSCLNVLEKCFPHMEAAAVPGMAIPLLQDDCINTNVDLDQLWDVIHLTSDDRTYRMDLTALKAEVQSWFSEEQMNEIAGAPQCETEAIARRWMARSGNRWRPYLTTCTYLAIAGDGQEEEPAIPASLKQLALAVECFHKASLIHDDIEDGDAERYGKPTLHVEEGSGVALNVGDFLLGEGYRLISEIDAPAESKVEMLRAAAQGHVTLSRGQGAELCWARNPTPLTSLEVLQIFREKTAPAFEVALRVGGYLGGSSTEVVEALLEYSEAVGIAYQIKDDLEDFSSGDAAGEGIAGDIQSGRPSLLLAIAHKRARNDEERDLIAALWSGEASYADVAETVHTLFEECEVNAKATELMRAYEEKAVRSLRFLENSTLKGLLRRVVTKIFPLVIVEGYCGEFEARNAPGSSASAERPGGS